MNAWVADRETKMVMNDRIRGQSITSIVYERRPYSHQRRIMSLRCCVRQKRSTLRHGHDGDKQREATYEGFHQIPTKIKERRKSMRRRQGVKK